MNRDIKWGDLFGPESLLGVVLGTTYLMLIVLRIVDISIGFGALAIIWFPLALTAGPLKRLRCELAAQGRPNCLLSWQLLIPGSIRHTKSAALEGTEMGMRDTEVRA